MVIKNHLDKKVQVPILNIFVFIYIFSVLTLNALPSYSRIDFYISIVIAGILFLKFLLTGQINMPRLIWLPWIFFFFATCSVIWAFNPKTALETVIALFTVIASASILWIALANGASIKVVMFSMVLSSIIIVFSTSYEILLGNEDVSRYAGILQNPNSLGIILSIISIFIIGLYKHKKAFVIYGVSLLTFATIYSGSRKIMFTWIVLSLLLFLKSKYKIKKNHIFYYNVIFLFIFLLIFYFAPTISMFFDNLSVFNRIEGIFTGSDYNSANIRGLMIKDGFTFWQNHLLIGNGIGQYEELSIYKTYSHNNYIELLSGLGIVGFILYYASYFYLLIKSLKLIKKKNKIAVMSLSFILLFFLWELALVSYIEQFTWLVLVILFYLTADQKDFLKIKN